jgi:MFS family permease
MLAHPLFQSLLSLRGNPRAAVYTEIMFGIPFTLYAPYVSIYMLALGVTDQQIGFISSLGLAFQVVASLVSGALTDKFGRRRTLFAADMLSWSLPCLIWAIAQDFRYFVVAAVFNSLWRVSHTAWTCLMVEDAEPDQLVPIWTWVQIFVLFSGMFAPLAGLFVDWFSLVPTVRGLFIFAFVMMTAKFFILFRFSTETRRGAERRQEARGQSWWHLLGEYRGVFAVLIRSPMTLVISAMILVMNIYRTINGAFWSVLVTEKLLIPSQYIAIYPFIRSVVMLAVFFLLAPRLSHLNFRRPVMLGFGSFVLSQLLLVTIPPGSYLLLGLSAVLEAFSTAMVRPMIESLLALAIDPAERARITALIYMVILLLSSPFGWIAGQLSAVDRSLPFVFNTVLFAAGILLVWLAARLQPEAPASKPA